MKEKYMDTAWKLECNLSGVDYLLDIITAGHVITFKLKHPKLSLEDL
jgi:hypothetical protein